MHSNLLHCKSGDFKLALQNQEWEKGDTVPAFMYGTTQQHPKSTKAYLEMEAVTSSIKLALIILLSVKTQTTTNKLSICCCGNLKFQN
jgi:hypothetical protein